MKNIEMAIKKYWEGQEGSDLKENISSVMNIFGIDPEDEFKEIPNIEAFWLIEISAACPNCREYFDILNKYPDFLNNGIEIGEHDTERTKNIKIVCPECKYKFKVYLKY